MGGEAGDRLEGLRKRVWQPFSSIYFNSSQATMKNFQDLITTIEQIHTHLQASAVHAVNQSLTMRNWLIGYYIVEFEQDGADRAEYGVKLLQSIATKLRHIKGLDERALRRFRKFYQIYPHLILGIRGTVSPILKELDAASLGLPEELSKEVILSTIASPAHSLQVPAEKIISRLSYSHIELLIKIEDPLKRTFYEWECIKGTWSVRELRRQMGSLYFERSGLSKNPQEFSQKIQEKVHPQEAKDIIKNIYAFEFLNLETRELHEESHLESALLDHLQHFILELGNGFCFEARQKRLLIGSTYYFIDLLFYHRVLKCHVLLELKIGAFEAGDIGQLNTYLNYFKKEIQEEQDKAPVGILLVADKDQALVEYATGGMDENLFIQQYLIRLPSLKQLKESIERELKEFI